MSENAWGKTTHHVWGEVDVVFAHSIVVVSRYIPARGAGADVRIESQTRARRLHISRAGIHIALQGAQIPAGEDGAWNGERGQIDFERGSFQHATHLPPTQSFPGPKHTFPLCKVVLIAQLASAAYPSAPDIPLESGLGTGLQDLESLRRQPLHPFSSFRFCRRGGHTFGNRQSKTLIKLSVCMSVCLAVSFLVFCARLSLD